MKCRVALMGLVVVSCASAPPSVESSKEASEVTRAAETLKDRQVLAEAAAGVDDARLSGLLEEHWAWRLKSEPLFATRMGMSRYDDALPDNSLEAVEQRHEQRQAFRQRLSAIDPARLSPRDRLTHAMLDAELTDRIEAHVCAFGQWTLSARSNPVTQFNYLPELHAIESPADARRLLARYEAIAGSIDQTVRSLREGLRRGLVAPKESARRVVEMVEKQLALKVEKWPLSKPARTGGAFAGGDHAAFAKRLLGIVKEQIKPALERYLKVLKAEVLPKAREEAESGLWALPIGKACYEARVRAFTTLTLTPKQVHRVGIESIAATDAEMAKYGKTALGTEGLSDTLARLRKDRSLYFGAREEVAEAARKTLALGRARMGGFFGRLPKANCVVVPIPDYEAPYTTIAYYRPPHADGSKPGEYFINTYEPATRPRYEAAVLAVHEAIPGHHLQIAISQELGAVPAFRKHGGVTAFVEGWGLYSERLGDEMGLYETDMDRIGMVSFDAWRAGRLVVDTGIHALGWSRSKARAYLEAHTALSPENIDNEVDRYINWPGQAVAYKIGQIEMRAMRKEAQERLGERFDVKKFHDTVLGAGAISLPLLKARVERYIKQASDQ